jgi:UDP-N-acetylglucosamine 2-epimerase (non-hydrolysing)
VEVTLDLVAGARPNFIKLAPVFRALSGVGEFHCRIIHTGQHYDEFMNDVFFEELEIPQPFTHLEVGSGTHGRQTAMILERYEAHLLEDPPDATVVFGDVNSTIGCALAAVKLGVPVVHVEAGLRSFDRTMPEEINRLLTDSISDLLFVTEQSGVDNLLREGTSEDRIRLVGNVMIDTLMLELERADDQPLQKLSLTPGTYGLLTLHRPSNVDDPSTLRALLDVFNELSKEIPLVFPVHPRTRRAIDIAGFQNILDAAPGILAVSPQSYRETVSLMRHARLVLTDSGGIQEETSFLRVPCLTLRENTERPITIELGTSELVGNDAQAIRAGFKKILAGGWREGTVIPLWDGGAAQRIANDMHSWLCSPD